MSLENEQWREDLELVVVPLHGGPLTSIPLFAAADDSTSKRRKLDATVQVLTLLSSVPQKSLRWQPLVVSQFSDCFYSTGCKVWESAILGALLWAHFPAYVAGKVVLELGSGCGVAGFVAARFAQRVFLTDHVPQLLENLSFIRTKLLPLVHGPASEPVDPSNVHTSDRYPNNIAIRRAVWSELNGAHPLLQELATYAPPSSSVSTAFAGAASSSSFDDSSSPFSSCCSSDSFFPFGTSTSSSSAFSDSSLSSTSSSSASSSSSCSSAAPAETSIPPPTSSSFSSAAIPVVPPSILTTFTTLTPVATPSTQAVFPPSLATGNPPTPDVVEDLPPPLESSTHVALASSSSSSSLSSFSSSSSTSSSSSSSCGASLSSPSSDASLPVQVFESQEPATSEQREAEDTAKDAGSWRPFENLMVIGTDLVYSSVAPIGILHALQVLLLGEASPFKPDLSPSPSPVAPCVEEKEPFGPWGGENATGPRALLVCDDSRRGLRELEQLLGGSCSSACRSARCSRLRWVKRHAPPEVLVDFDSAKSFCLYEIFPNPHCTSWHR